MEDLKAFMPPAEKFLSSSIFSGTWDIIEEAKSESVLVLKEEIDIWSEVGNELMVVEVRFKYGRGQEFIYCQC